MKVKNIFTNMEILFEFISYFFEYEHFKMDILLCGTPCVSKCIVSSNHRQFNLNTYWWMDHRNRTDKPISFLNLKCWFRNNRWGLSSTSSLTVCISNVGLLGNIYFNLLLLILLLKDGIQKIINRSHLW